MQKYRYVALNLNKKKFTGTFIAENVKELTNELAKQNLYLISAKPVSDTVQASFFSFSIGSGAKISDLTTFCRQFAIMINSGISIVDTIGILKTQSFSTYFKQVLDSIHEDIKGGIMLSESIKKYKKVFPKFFQSMVYVGEISGQLDKVLNELADYYEKDAAIKRKMKSAMAYPLMLLAMTIGIVVLMMAFVIPTFNEALSNMDVEMPALTKAITSMSDFMRAKWKEIILVVALIALLVFLFLKSKTGSYLFDTFLVNCPILKNVVINSVTSKFARGFGLLIASGLDMVDAMEVISKVLGKKNVQKRFEMAIEDVRQGMTLTMAFESYKLFPPILIQMVSVGEKTGELDDVLMRSCSFFDEQVETALARLTAIIQPTMLIIMGGIVGLMFVAIYSPMLSIMTSLG